MSWQGSASSPGPLEQGELAVWEVREARLLIDAHSYFNAFRRAAQKARRCILLSGWQFDTEVELVRGADREAGVPSRFLPFLNYLCEREPHLEVYIVAWDYSFVYAAEREKFQALKTLLKTHPRVHFDYWTHPNPGGAHHHKFAVIDDAVAFVGGLDICDSRLDDRLHVPDLDSRCTIDGKPYKAFHDLQLALTGPVVTAVREIFTTFYGVACKESFTLPSCEPTGAPGLDLLAPDGLRLRTGQVALAETVYEQDGGRFEVEAVLTRAISRAEHLIYIENQYFTSRAVLAAFLGRLKEEGRGRLDIVLVMPDGADSPKEDFVLGDRQRAVRYALFQAAEAHGHRVRFLVSRGFRADGSRVATFIHGKLLIVDDSFLTVGSANLTNRSMRIDSELNVVLEGAGDLADDIRQVRASLLAEHAGAPDLAPFLALDSLIETIDRSASDPSSKLEHLTLEPPDGDEPLLMSLFDPSSEISAETLANALEEELRGVQHPLQVALQKAGQRLGIIDIP